MKLFTGLKKIREFERQQLPFLKSVFDFDIVIEIGYAEEQRWRPGVLPGAFLAGQLRARVPRGSPDRGAARRLPAGGQPWRPVVVSASVADAGFLGVLDGVIGDRRDHLDLPGAVHEIPAGARDRGD